MAARMEIPASNGQLIDISVGDDIIVYGSKTKEWVSCPTKFSNVENGNFLAVLEGDLSLISSPRSERGG